MPVEGYNAYLSCLEFDELPKLKVPRHTLLELFSHVTAQRFGSGSSSDHIAYPGFAITLYCK
jgi:hypothetical protein